MHNMHNVLNIILFQQSKLLGDVVKAMHCADAPTQDLCMTEAKIISSRSLFASLDVAHDLPSVTVCL